MPSEGPQLPQRRAGQEGPGKLEVSICLKVILWLWPEVTTSCAISKGCKNQYLYVKLQQRQYQNNMCWEAGLGPGRAVRGAAKHVEDMPLLCWGGGGDGQQWNQQGQPGASLGAGSSSQPCSERCQVWGASKKPWRSGHLLSPCTMDLEEVQGAWQIGMGHATGQGPREWGGYMGC